MALDLQAVAAQMDSTVSQLRAAWSQLQIKVLGTTWFQTDQQAAAIDRLNSIRGIIDTLDYTTRSYVLTLGGPFGSQDAAWNAWCSGAADAADSMNELATFLGEWSLSATLVRMAREVKKEIKGDSLMLLGGVVLLLILLRR